MSDRRVPGNRFLAWQFNLDYRYRFRDSNNQIKGVFGCASLLDGILSSGIQAFKQRADALKASGLRRDINSLPTLFKTPISEIGLRK